MNCRSALSAVALLCLGGCAHGNLHTGSARPLKPPKVAQALYDPYAPYGSAPVRWSPSVATYDGSIVKPQDPMDQGDRPDYEHAKWGANYASEQAGTF
ncbi:hypothetical protein [Acetobacter syzygii]|uniref:Uncharacterized protein n=1 Tax=Acetobacter syzygii TaxID=146476 RepID=A0A270B6E1_9PROT|nr:hypothetical protein [Acetobacter syzygii]NSL92718.1 hypothetical protein [Acetobacter syzygii]PAL20577.1 hypothetical protein B9K05_12815 [Acetobacter syzygii]PAL21190.1 hypothetical protein B9K04_12960 [Acetobacter syzygii]